MGRSDSLGLGIIGCGRIARMRHLPILSKTNRIRLAAASDLDPAMLAQVADQYAIAHRYSDYRALLADPEVDAVLVCTPPRSHFIHARDVLLSNRHLYVDSPLALSAEECDELVDIAERSDRVATVGLNLRHHSYVQRTRECVEAGLLGPLQAINAIFSTPSRGSRGDIFPAWREPDTVDGSVFGECAIQHFDTWRALTGADFTEVFVQAPRIGGPVSFTAEMRRKNDPQHAPIVAAAVFSEYSGDNSEVRVIGDKGTIALSFYRYDGFLYCPALVTPGSWMQHLSAFAESARSLPQGLANLIHGGEYGITFRRQLEKFIEACLGGKAASVSLMDGRAVTVAALAAYRSMITGQKVSIAYGLGSS